jgi:hypothetical protein
MKKLYKNHLAAENQGLTAVTPKIGKTMRLENAKDFQIRWWENVE